MFVCTDYRRLNALERQIERIDHIDHTNCTLVSVPAGNSEIVVL